MSDHKRLLTVDDIRAEARKGTGAVRLGDRFSEWVDCAWCKGRGRFAPSRMPWPFDKVQSPELDCQACIQGKQRKHSVSDHE